MDYADIPHNLQILLIEDNPGDVRLLQEILSKIKGGSFALEWFSSLSEGLERLTTDDIDIVLLDLLLPDSQGLDTFIQVQAHSPQVPIIILSGLDDEALAVEAVREHIANQLGMGVVEAASGILKVINSNMADQLRLVSVYKGYDPRDFSFVAFGGANNIAAHRPFNCNNAVRPVDIFPVQRL